MNQILINIKNKKFNKKLFFIQFILFFIISTLLIVYLLYQYYFEKNKSIASKNTIKTYSILRLYSNSMSSNFVADKNKISIIGTISIPKIDIKYPILSDYSDELLKISVCKFYGPNINDVGNLCIIGHNYNTNVFFSKVFLLKINDQIILTDSNLNSVTYFIYNTYEVEPNDLSYLSQDTNRY